MFAFFIFLFVLSYISPRVLTALSLIEGIIEETIDYMPISPQVNKYHKHPAI